MLNPWGVTVKPTHLELAPPKPPDQNKAFITSPMENRLFVNASEPFEGRRMTSGNELGGTWRWAAAAPSSGSMTVTLLQGMAFMTVVYDSLTPLLRMAATIIEMSAGAADNTAYMVCVVGGACASVCMRALLFHAVCLLAYIHARPPTWRSYVFELVNGSPPLHLLV